MSRVSSATLLLAFRTSSFLSQFRKARRRNAMLRQIRPLRPSPADCNIAKPRADAVDPSLAMRLWDVSEKLVVAL